MAILVIRCSSEQKIPPQPETYSPNSEKEFEDIEDSDLDENPPMAPILKAAPRHSAGTKEPSHEKPKEAAKETSKETIKTSPVSLNQLSVKNQERLQEINQNLAFFCMKHRNEELFKNEEHCLAFTKKVLAECEKKHKLLNTVMVNCIKDRLKKR